MLIKLYTKTFTRGERRAFNELYRITKGFKSVPKSRNPRDVARLKQLAMDVDDLLRTGEVDKFDKEGAKILLNNLGLKKGAGQVDKLVEKYGNKEAIKRLKRQTPSKDRRLDRERYNTFAKLDKELQKQSKKFKSIQPSSTKLEGLAEDRIRELAKKNNIKIEISSDPIVNSQGGAFYIKGGKGGIKRKYKDRELLDYFKEIGNDGNSFSIKNGQSKVLKDTNYDGQIFVHPDLKSSGLFGHEMGHALEPIKFQEHVIKSKSGVFNPILSLNLKTNKLNKLSKGITTLASENSATAKSLANQNKIAKDAKNLIDKKEIKKWKNDSERSLDAARQTYILGGLKDLTYHRPKYL